MLASPFWQKDTTNTFIALLDNYEREVGTVEKVNREEKTEMDDFMDALMASPVMKFAFNWLRHHSTDKRCQKNFRSEWAFVWLALMQSDGRTDSSSRMRSHE